MTTHYPCAITYTKLVTNHHGSDPKYEEEVSGCTACVGLINDDKIFIVR